MALRAPNSPLMIYVGQLPGNINLRRPTPVSQIRDPLKAFYRSLNAALACVAF